MATRAVAQTVCFVAWDTTNNVGKTGDGANFTMRWVKDGTSAALTVTTVTEIDSTNAPGLYKVGISSTESDCNIGYLAGKSSTSAISIMPVKLEFERLPDAVPGAAGGIFIAGTNAACTITGNFAIQGGVTVTQSSSNQPAFIATGNGTGQGARFVGGNGAAGVDIAGTGAASGLTIAAGTGAGTGLSVVGGGTSGVGISVTTTSGDGVSILPTAGHGIVATGQGASKHGMQLTGGGSGTCDGLKAVAGTGGVAIRGPVDVVTLVNTLTTYTGNTPQTGDSFALIGAAGAGLTALATQSSVNTIDDLLDTEMPALTTAVGAIKTKTDFLPSATAGASGGLFIAGTNAATTVTTSFTTTFTGNLTGNVGGNVTGSVGSIATGGIDSASFAAGAITATAIATDAIGSNELAASAISEIQSGLATSSALTSAASDITSILADTNELQTDWANGGRLDLLLDATLADTNELQTDWANGGRLDLIVDAILDDTGTAGVVVNAAGLATDAVTEIVTAIFANAPTEAYATDGAVPTFAQYLAMIYSVCSQFDISSTTLTTRKLDGTTSAMVFTLDSASAPTSRVRSS